MRGANTMPFTENTFEQALLEEFESKGYEHLYGPNISRDYHQVIQETYFYESMFKINHGITQEIAEEAYKQIKNIGFVKLAEINQAFHKFLVEGVSVPFKRDGENRTFQVKLIDFDKSEKNNFHVINQYTVIEYKTKRPDILIFINGIPMVVFELKSAVSEDATMEYAYNQVKNYQLYVAS